MFLDRPTIIINLLGNYIRSVLKPNALEETPAPIVEGREASAALHYRHGIPDRPLLQEKI